MRLLFGIQPGFKLGEPVKSSTRTRLYIDPTSIGFISPASLRGGDSVSQGAFTSRSPWFGGWYRRSSVVVNPRWDLLRWNTTLTIDISINSLHTRTIGQRFACQIAPPTWPTSLRCEKSTDFNYEDAWRVHDSDVIRISLPLSLCDLFGAVAAAATVRYASRMRFFPPTGYLCFTGYLLLKIFGGEPRMLESALFFVVRGLLAMNTLRSFLAIALSLLTLLSPDHAARAFEFGSASSFQKPIRREIE
jgi:hypothetical protein